jgi:hypothetical protein
LCNDGLADPRARTQELHLLVRAVREALVRLAEAERDCRLGARGDERVEDEDVVQLQGPRTIVSSRVSVASLADEMESNEVVLWLKGSRAPGEETLTWVRICVAEKPSLETISTAACTVSKPDFFAVPGFVSTSISTSESGTSTPSAAARRFMMWSGTTPPISWTESAVMGVLSAAWRREADWR